MVLESYTENWKFFLNFGLNLAIENDVEEDLAEFGYMLNIKFYFLKHCSFFWLWYLIHTQETDDFS
jgi:hypothetical protein